jgi:rsbT co-antagonist protein RsbR
MASGEEARELTVADERVEQVLVALGLVSAGIFDEARARLGELVEDRFGMVEESLRIFIEDVQKAHEESRAALLAVQTSKAELEQKLATIERQQQEIRELATPVLEVWDNILTLPLVGHIDAGRAIDMTERLLHRIVETRSRWVILDLTAISGVDTSTAEHLLRLSSTARFLGCRCVMTGIGPTLAGTLTGLGIPLDGFVPLRTLKEGLAYCRMAEARGQSPGERTSR